jgi:hypothetical protein
MPFITRLMTSAFRFHSPEALVCSEDEERPAGEQRAYRASARRAIRLMPHALHHDELAVLGQHADGDERGEQHRHRHAVVDVLGQQVPEVGAPSCPRRRALENTLSERSMNVEM